MLRRPSRSGQLNGTWLAFLGSTLLLGGLVVVLIWDPAKWFARKEKRTLVVYCAAGLKTPVEQIAREYEEEYGVRIRLIYGGSATLLGNMEADNVDGDLYIPGDDSYINIAREKGLVDEELPAAHMKLVLAVPKGRGDNIRSVEDLVKKDWKLSLADPKRTAVGKLTRAALNDELWEKLQKKTRVLKLTVTEVATDIEVGAVDAGIVWDATVRQFSNLEMVELKELKKQRSDVSVAVLRSCKQPATALQFARYLTARDKGLKTFDDHGYTPNPDGDLWDEEPQLVIYAGAMLRPAIEHTLRDFEKREGIPRIRMIYNGCGILVGQMQTGQRPDAYFACDASFMTQVQDLFHSEVTLSTNQLVILVHKGNPKNLKTLDDLTRPGLKLGVGNEHQCAMGLLTQNALKEGKVQKKVNENVKVQSATGDFLVNQMLAAPSKLDAVIVYISNANLAKDKLDAIPISVKKEGEDKDCAIASQPLAVGRECKYKYLAGRLMRALMSSQSKERFEQAGFTWQGAK